MSEPVSAILGLGSNLGNRQEIISSAIADLAEIDGIKVKKVSPLVESHAMTIEGLDRSKPNYLNAVIKIKTTLKPKELLSKIREVETKHGRVRIERWGSRTLDIDIVTYANLVKASKELTLPHPRAYERAFVIVPWSLIDSEAILPGHGSVAELAKTMQSEVWVTE